MLLVFFEWLFAEWFYEKVLWKGFGFLSGLQPHKCEFVAFVCWRRIPSKLCRISVNIILCLWQLKMNNKQSNSRLQVLLLKAIYRYLSICWQIICLLWKQVIMVEHVHGRLHFKSLSNWSFIDYWAFACRKSIMLKGNFRKYCSNIDYLSFLSHDEHSL